MKTGKYRIKKINNNSYIPQYQVKFLCFKWWNTWYDICIDGLEVPRIYHNQKSAEKHINKEKEHIQYINL